MSYINFVSFNSIHYLVWFVNRFVNLSLSLQMLFVKSFSAFA
nr:MAG TPA: hypothetical protein [Caudoviricetes sp.]